MEIKGARENNLKNIDVKFPLHTITVVTGVSGSGKSSLVSDILYSVLSNRIGGNNLKPGQFRELAGDYTRLTGIELVDQNPIGKSTRSNPVTYLKAYDEIRKLYANSRHRYRIISKPHIFHSILKEAAAKNVRAKA